MPAIGARSTIAPEPPAREAPDTASDDSSAPISAQLPLELTDLDAGKREQRGALFDAAAELDVDALDQAGHGRAHVRHAVRIELDPGYRAHSGIERGARCRHHFDPGSLLDLARFEAHHGTRRDARCRTRARLAPLRGRVARVADGTDRFGKAMLGAPVALGPKYGLQRRIALGAERLDHAVLGAERPL
jgi:hypothetical protein